MRQAPAPEELTYFRIGLDDEATELLFKLSAITGQEPRETLGRLVRDILIEDAEAHSRPVQTDGPNLH